MPKWQHSCDHPCTDMGKPGACDALFIDPTTSQPKSGCLETHLLSVPVLVDLCTGALTEKKKYSPSFANQSWRGEKNQNKTQFFKVSAQRMQSSEHKTAGGVGSVLLFPVVDGKLSIFCIVHYPSMPTTPPKDDKYPSTQKREKEY